MSSSISAALVVVISMICTNVITPPPGATGWPDDGPNLSARPRTWSGACPERLEAQSRCQGQPRDQGQGDWRLRGSGGDLCSSTVPAVPVGSPSMGTPSGGLDNARLRAIAA